MRSIPLFALVLLGTIGCTQGTPEEAASRFATLQAAGDATGQRGLVTDADARVVDSVAVDSKTKLKLLVTSPTLGASIDSARETSRHRDSAHVAVFWGEPNLEGLPDSLRLQKENDLEFLRSRPRRTFVDTLIAVREHRRWRIAIDAVFSAGVYAASHKHGGSDATLAEQLAGLTAVEEYHRSHGRPVNDYIKGRIEEVRKAVAYQDSLVVSGTAEDNPLFQNAPSLGTRMIKVAVRNIGSRPVYMTDIVVTLETGERKPMFMFDVLPGQVDSNTDFGTFTGGIKAIHITGIQFNRQTP